MYDKEKVYDDKISPLMAEIIKICKEEQIPLIASFYIKEETEEAGKMLCTTNLPFDNQPDSFKEAYRIIYDKPSVSAFTITTKGKDGEIRGITKVFP